MTIVFVHPHKAFLPEIEAYIRYFRKYPVQCEVTTKEKARLLKPQVEWFFMGTDVSKPRHGIYKIHEYASASVPPGRRWKDRMKRYFNAQPDFRLFLNEYVNSRFGFSDGIPWGYRDMGLDPSWLAPPAVRVEKEYDFVYCGSVTKDIAINRLLNHFLPAAPMAGRNLLVVSREYEAWQQQYRAASNIQFIGPVPHDHVQDFIRKAHFAINYKPAIEPHSYQTVTKLLEYAACKTPVITTRLPWVIQLQQHYGGDFFYLEPDLSNFTWEAVQQFPFSFPDLSEWTWEKQIRLSGVLEFLQSKFPELAFS
jgi:glycosyltransferase involved in cell wall biosynthesis